MERACERLTSHDIKLSAQRIAIMEYLMHHLTHPSADAIHSALVERLPTLSKTTVYNTLRLFVEQGAVSMLTIDGREACFDAEIHPHAHFQCRRCGRIIDLPEDKQGLLSCTRLSEGMKVESVSLYVYGICPDCNASNTSHT